MNALALLVALGAVEAAAGMPATGPVDAERVRSWEKCVLLKRLMLLEQQRGLAEEQRELFPKREAGFGWLLDTLGKFLGVLGDRGEPRPWALLAEHSRDELRNCREIVAECRDKMTALDNAAQGQAEAEADPEGSEASSDVETPEDLRAAAEDYAALETRAAGKKEALGVLLAELNAATGWLGPQGLPAPRERLSSAVGLYGRHAGALKSFKDALREEAEALDLGDGEKVPDDLPEKRRAGVEKQQKAAEALEKTCDEQCRLFAEMSATVPLSLEQIADAEAERCSAGEALAMEQIAEVAGSADSGALEAAIGRARGEGEAAAKNLGRLFEEKWLLVEMRGLVEGAAGAGGEAEDRRRSALDGQVAAVDGQIAVVARRLENARRGVAKLAEWGGAAQAPSPIPGPPPAAPAKAAEEAVEGGGEPSSAAVRWGVAGAFAVLVAALAIALLWKRGPA